MKSSFDKHNKDTSLFDYITIFKNYYRKINILLTLTILIINIIFSSNFLHCSTIESIKDVFLQEDLPKILILSKEEKDILLNSEKISIAIDKEKNELNEIENLLNKINSQLEIKNINTKLHLKPNSKEIEADNINYSITNNISNILLEYKSLKNKIELCQKENKLLLDKENRNITSIEQLIKKWEILAEKLKNININDKNETFYLELNNFYKKSIKNLQDLSDLRKTNKRIIQLHDKNYSVLFTQIEISEGISKSPSFGNINLSNTMGLNLRLKLNEIPESIDNNEIKTEITKYTNKIFKKNTEDYQYKHLEKIFIENNILTELNKLRKIEEDRHTFYLNELDNENKRLIFLANNCKKLVNNYCIKLQDSLPMELSSIYEAINELIWFASSCKFNIYILLHQFIIITILYTTFLIFLRRIHLNYNTFINEINKNIGTINRDNFYNTLISISWEILNSSKLSLLLLTSGAGLLYFNQINNTDSIQAIGTSFIKISFVSLLMSCLCNFAKNNGIFEKHFKINKKPLNIIFSKWSLLSFVFQFTLFIFLASTDNNIAHRMQTTAKFSLIAMCLVASLFIIQLIRSDIKIFAVSSDKFKSLLDKLLILTTLIIVFYTAKRTWDGFFETSKVIMNNLGKSVLIWISLMLLYQMVIRIMVLQRRRIAFELSLQQREELLANRLKKFSEENDDRETEELEIDLEKLSSQTIKLVRSLTQLIGVLSLLTICSKIKPIFNILALPIPFLHEATPLSIFSTSLFCYLVYLLYANLPSLLDLIIFTKFDLTQSSRYNLKYFTKILVLLSSIIIACNLLNLDTNNIALLGTIFTASIGFGLRDLVSSICSGIIILTMKSLRVGDTVKINNITGIVTQITILNTTLLALDRKEIVIPNKNLLNEIFIMWPSEEFIYRTVFIISVPINFNTLNVLNEIKKSVETIQGISNNESFIFSVASGQLNYELRVFISDIQNTENVQTEIFNNILNNLSKIGIPRECINIKQLST